MAVNEAPIKLTKATPYVKSGKRKKLNLGPRKLFLQKIAPILTQKCSQAVKAFKAAGGPLYRGSKNHGPAYVGRSVQNRRAVDLDDDYQDSIDAYFQAAGFKAMRNNSIFATGDPDDAEDYGTNYIIFPVDGFNFTWSPKVSDLYNDSEVRRKKYATVFNYTNPDKYGNLVDRFAAKIMKSNLYDYIDEMVNIADDERSFTSSDAAKRYIARFVKSVDRWEDIWYDYSQLETDIYEDIDELQAELWSLHTNKIPKAIKATSQIIKEMKVWAVEDRKKSKIFGRTLSNYFYNAYAEAINDLKGLVEFQKLVARIYKSLQTPAKVSAKQARLEMSKLGFTNKNLVAAVNSDNEVYINGLYYAFRRNEYEDIILDWLRSGK